MRGEDVEQQHMFSYVSLEDRIPKNHPLREIRVLVDRLLDSISDELDAVYSGTGRPSIPPERLIRALLLQALYSIRSGRLLMEQLDCNLLFRWFVGLQVDDPVWHPTTFTKSRDRLIEAEVAQRLLRSFTELEEVRPLLSDEHFSVDGTLIEAWASMKSFKPISQDGDSSGDDDLQSGGRNPTVNFRGQQRRNDTHASSTDPNARLYRKGQGQPARLCYIGHALMENRHGLIVDTRLTQACGTAEREAALEMIREIPAERGRLTLAGDAGYNTRDFVQALREYEVTPHVAEKRRFNAVDGRTTRHPGYAVSQRIRKRVEEFFGWSKTVGGLRKTRFIGPDRVGWDFGFHALAYNLVRTPKLLGAG
ncbi:IS5-like element ISHha2 family transposase [Halorhodospira halophila]|uniref:Transposase, IS4 family n=1 Tax=Halorhodospira halophila (strain DSM 244 / SL1) TaxID=349124 RepID=A1WU46_HALHL|nr:IS5-like element ISHha2 family transposase [Halorhodospira halophila]ABM61208.1 transposase, IS4 family [Halorhodospira halophila SL1]MBK1730154.1 IS5 family transposase ISHha2 [Halorhodospira halophila]